MFAGNKSLSGNTCATIFVNGGRCTFVHPLTRKNFTLEALKDFYNTVKSLDTFTKMEGESSLRSSGNAHVYPERY